MEERLQKYIARCGIASRRKSEELILSGKVKVNGVIISELGTKINSEIDNIEVDGKLIKPEERKVYIILNKPTGIVSTVNDEKNRKTLIDVVKTKERIYPIGRLDYDTSGLILLTNDGDIYNRIIHPRSNINKVYIANVNGVPSEEEIENFKRGLKIENYITAPADIKIIKVYNNTSDIQVTIHEGKNRQVRKMCDKIGHPVISLKRISVGNINLKNLKVGEWRYLTNDELNYLKSL